MYNNRCYKLTIAKPFGIYCETNWKRIHSLVVHAESKRKLKMVTCLKWIMRWWRCDVCGCTSSNNRTATNWTATTSGCSICWNRQHIDFLLFSLFSLLFSLAWWFCLLLSIGFFPGFYRKNWKVDWMIF